MIIIRLLCLVKHEVVDLFQGRGDLGGDFRSGDLELVVVDSADGFDFVGGEVFGSDLDTDGDALGTQECFSIVLVR